MDIVDPGSGAPVNKYNDWCSEGRAHASPFNSARKTFFFLPLLLVRFPLFVVCESSLRCFLVCEMANGSLGRSTAIPQPVAPVILDRKIFSGSAGLRGSIDFDLLTGAGGNSGGEASVTTCPNPRTEFRASQWKTGKVVTGERTVRDGRQFEKKVKTNGRSRSLPPVASIID